MYVTHLLSPWFHKPANLVIHILIHACVGYVISRLSWPNGRRQTSTDLSSWKTMPSARLLYITSNWHVDPNRWQHIVHRPILPSSPVRMSSMDLGHTGRSGFIMRRNMIGFVPMRTTKISLRAAWSLKTESSSWVSTRHKNCPPVKPWDDAGHRSVDRKR